MANEEQAPVASSSVQQAPVAPSAVPELSFGDKLNAGAGYLWKNDKVFLIVFGILILLAYISGTLMDLLTSKSNKDVADAKEQDAKLAAKEDVAKSQAASYEKQDKQAAQNEPKVGEDWNVKK